MTIVDDTAALMSALVSRRTRLCLPCLVATTDIPVDRVALALGKLHRHVIVLQHVERCTACGEEGEIYNLTLAASP